MSQRKLLIIIAMIILVISGIWCFFVIRSTESRYITISQDGKELYRIDLAHEKDRTIEVEYEGRKNIIEIKDCRVHMKEADCPDHICIETGWLSDGKPIVCLPNRLVIEFEESELDAAAG